MTRASLNIGRPFGIEITIHWSFWLVVIWAAAEGIRWSGSWRGALFAVLAILLFFGCVLLHELGHAFAAKAFNIEVTGVMLLPIGGVAKIRHMPEKGWQEFVIALAGPAMNLIIALGLGAVMLLLWGTGVLVGLEASPRTVLRGILLSVFGGGSTMAMVAFLVLANFLLAIFNLVPAFPMDGGRVFRAVLSGFMPYKVATRLAVRTGQLLAVIAIIFSLTPHFNYQSPGAVLIAVFVFVGATYEDRLVQLRSRLDGIQVVDVMTNIIDIMSVSPHDIIGTTMERILKSPHFDLPVLGQGVLVGILRRDDVLQALKQGQSGLSVADIMRTDYPSVVPTDALKTAQMYMVSSKFTTLPVLHEGSLIGLINIRDVKLVPGAAVRS